MTHDEIRAAIGADPALQALVPDTVALAAALSEGRKRWKPTEIGVGTIIEVLGLAAANPVLDALYASPDYRHVKPLLEQGRLRLDVVAQAGLLEPLVAGGLLTQAQLDALVARAKEPAPVAEYDVRVAIYADDGSLRV
ncbi:hypothetical protein [Thauera sp. 2A1]|uniref:hypothetical protein n=1 Tax=Thauera sp. 2A1 TaxID=2570191 RepID=UPI0012918AC1|nr:hypothetical protein [Thauera sp. 2A1]KAI5914619.1 hypothetical protein GH664_11780 [Thauera sp. 2A1]